MAYARDEGLEQGRRSERQAVAKRLIQGRFNNAEIVQITRLTEKEVCQIRKKLKQ